MKSRIIAILLVFMLPPFTWGGQSEADSGQEEVVLPGDLSGAPGSRNEVGKNYGAGERKQRDLLRARIFIRKGYPRESLKIYKRLRKQFPEDLDIRADYAEALISTNNYEAAVGELRDLLEKSPSHLRGARLLARLYTEAGRAEWAFPVYEDILGRMKGDPGLWSDYAYGRVGSGDWETALECFHRALDLDPGNGELLRSLHEILRDHSPSLESGYRTYSLDSDESTVKTLTLRYRGHLTTATSLELTLHDIHVTRPPQTGISPLDYGIKDIFFLLHHRLNSSLLVKAGAGRHDGKGKGTSLFLGLDIRFPRGVSLGVDYEHNRPWYDPVDTVAYGGCLDRFFVTLDWAPRPAWGILLSAGLEDYTLRDTGDYGTKQDMTFILTRRFTESPDFSLSYSYYRSRFLYSSEMFRPISMIESEAVHGLSGRLEVRPRPYWGWVLSGGITRDFGRKVDTWRVVPGIRFRFGNRVEGSLDYEYSSESRTAAGGVTRTFWFLLKVIL
ncbi:MAG: tetratricopeptide repeat protein [Deltaproteobacteria bacterium]|nr:tetratricopeptide repeat protein [Deltaproteobacteria bacterium]MBW2015701.1 tetratricopeptide repeat protein [Deltaproteobacteria bacterium]